MKTQSSINTFIKSLVDKNYKQANQELHKVVENKIKSKVSSIISLKKQQ